jgi:hypothetical protein
MDYRATYRRGEVAIPAVLIVAVAMIGGVWLAIVRLEGNAAVSAALWVLGLSALAITFVFAGVFRRHHWTVASDGITIAERQIVPLTGPNRNACLAWSDIAGVRRVEAGFDRQIELVAHDGRRFRMSQAIKVGVGVDPDAPLEDFLSHILHAAAAGGANLGAATEGLSFWNRVPGLAILTIFFAIALAFGGAAVLMLLDGEIVDGRRSGEGTAIGLALPVGAGWLLWKSLRRRREVMRGR